MADARYSPAEIERVTAERFTKFTNYLKSQHAYPMICIAQGAVGDKRSHPEPILCIPQELSDSGSIDWLIEVLEATLQVFKGQRDRLRPNVVMPSGVPVDPATISLEAMFGPPPGSAGSAGMGGI